MCLNLDFLIPYLLLDLGSLELISKLSLSPSSIDLFVKVGFLQLEGPGVVLYLRVCFLVSGLTNYIPTLNPLLSAGIIHTDEFITLAELLNALIRKY